MSKINLDLKLFKHVKSDDKSTTLSHKDGHELTIAHKGLSPEAKSQLEALRPKEEPKEQVAAEEPQQEVQQFKKGGYVQPASGPIVEDMPEEVPVVEMPQLSPEQKRRNELYNQEVDQQMGYLRAMDGMGGVSDPSVITDQVKMSFDPSGKPPESFDPKIWEKAKASQQEEKAISTEDALLKEQEQMRVNQARQEAGLAPIGNEVMAAPQAPVSDVPVAPPSAQPMQEPQAQGPSLMGGYDKAMAGISQAAQAQGDLGKQQAAMLQKQEQVLRDSQAKYDEKFNELESERQALMQDVKDGHVDPNKFWDNHSRIAAGIGMILAGFNPTSAPNAAINFLNQEMDRNIQAQAKNLDSKQNLLSANLRQFGNMKDAADMTRIMQSDMLANQLQQAAAKAQSPMAKAAALQAAGKLEMETGMMMQKFAATQAAAALANDASVDPSKKDAYLAALDRSNPDLAKDLRSRDVPGVPGFARTKDDADSLKQVQERRQMIKDNTTKAIQMIKEKGTYEAVGPHNDTLNGLIDQIAVDTAKLQDPNSVARPGEVELVRKSLAESGIFSLNTTAEKKLRNFYDTIDARANQAFTARGMKPPPAPGIPGGETKKIDPRKALAWAMANKDNPQHKAQAEFILANTQGR